MIILGFVGLSAISFYFGKADKNSSSESSLMVQNLEALSNDEVKKNYLVVTYRNEEHTWCVCSGTGDKVCCGNRE